MTIASGLATLQEGGRVNTALTQPFFIPAGVTTLRFTIDSATLGDAPDRPPDAFEAALLDARTLQPLTQTAAGLADTDAFLNIQSDGTFFASPQVTIIGADQNGGLLGDNVPRMIELDISKVPANTLAVVSFDLIGFGAPGSSVAIGNAQVTNNAPHAPVAVPDLATTNEDTAVSISDSENDTAAGAPLDPASVVDRAGARGTARPHSIRRPAKSPTHRPRAISAATRSPITCATPTACCPTMPP